MKSLLGETEEVAQEAFRDNCFIDYDELCGLDFRAESVWSVMKQGDVKRRTARNGQNALFLGRYCVVSAYTYWEVYLRREIAIAKGVFARGAYREGGDEEKTVLSRYVRSDFWGDMGKFRQAILHKNGVANSEIAKCKVLTWFKPGDPIDLCFDKMSVIFAHMAHFRNALHYVSFPKQGIKLFGNR